MNCNCNSKSSWKARNDSSNISAILAPTNCECNSSHSFRKTKKSKPQKPLSQLPAAHCETCYCRQTPQRPLLNLKPFAERKIKSSRECSCLTSTKEIEDGTKSARSEKLLKEAHKKLDYIPKTVFLRRLKEEAHKNCGKPCCGGGFTKQRKDYEELVQEENHQRQRASLFEDKVSPRLRGGDDDVCQNNCDCAKCKDQRILVENAEKVSAIENFRNENYFETHSTADLVSRKDVGDHKCIHRFSLDDRLIPIPENPDVFGASRCVICDKPMLEEDLSKKTVDSRLKVKKSKGTITENPYKGLVSLEPRKLYVPMKDEEVEVKVPLGFEVEDVYSKFKKFKRPRPVSSMALRYQKGVL